MDGAQDVYLTGSPSITFWKLVYRRHTSFACESIEQVFNGSVGYGRKVSATVSRNGDLVTTAYLEITLKKAAGDAFYPAEAFVKEIELEIGGQKIDRVNSDWYRLYDELFRTDAEKAAYKRLTNFDAGAENGCVKRFYVPLIFYFNKNPGLALPLIALTLQRGKASCRIHGGSGSGKTTWTSSSTTSDASLHTPCRHHRRSPQDPGTSCGERPDGGGTVEATLSNCGKPVKPVGVPKAL
jgi:Major capsid protein N-terminus